MPELTEIEKRWCDWMRRIGSRFVSGGAAESLSVLSFKAGAESEAERLCALAETTGRTSPGNDDGFSRWNSGEGIEDVRAARLGWEAALREFARRARGGA